MNETVKLAQSFKLQTKWWNPFTWYRKKLVYNMMLTKKATGGHWHCDYKSMGKIYRLPKGANPLKLESEGEFIGSLPSEKGITLKTGEQYYFVINNKQL